MLHLSTIEPTTLGLLKDLMKKPYLESFILVGGTSLALQIGHRISVDLDLFSNQLFEPEDLKENLTNDYSDVHIELIRPNSLITRILNIKVDFIRFKYGFNYPLIVDDKLRLGNIRDIASMKLDAIKGRGRKKDFFDLYFLLKKLSLTEMLELYQQKFPDNAIFQVVKSINYFADAENDPDPIVFDKKISWDKVKKTIANEIQKL